MRYLLIFLLTALTALGADRITATITITNIPLAGDSITVNADTRTWIGTVATPSSQVATGATIQASATNLFQHVAGYPFTTLTVRRASTNDLILTGLPGQSVAVSLDTNWASIAYSTQTVTAAYSVRVPMAVESSGQRTYIASQLASDLSASSTNPIISSSTLAGQLVGITNTQTITGTKTFSAATLSGTVTNAAIYGTTGIVSNLKLINPALTNAIAYSGFSSRGASNYAEAFGQQASALQGESLAVGAFAYADGIGATAVGSGFDVTVVQATANYAAAFGSTAWASGVGSTALGNSATASHQNSTALGYSSVTTESNQVRIGNASVSVSIAKNLSAGDNVSIGNDWEDSFPASMAGGLMINNGTAPAANPTNAAVAFVESGELKYRASAASEGIGANNRVHNRGAEVVGSGADYSLAAAYALVDFGGTDAELNTIPSAGTYLIQAQVYFAGATAADDLYAKFYNATDASDISNTEVFIDSTGGREHVQLSTIATFTAAKRIQIFAKNGTSARGTVTAIYTKIWYVRLY